MTRAQRAAQLLERVKRGPSFSDFVGSEQEKISARYRLWVESWIVEDLHALVPELRKQKGDAR